MTKTATITRLFHTPPEDVYLAYWRLDNWSRALPSILEARAEYDDGIHQCFTMVVNGVRGRETVRGVRIGAPFRRIELCQLVPPPGFAMMRGEWRFDAVTTGRGTNTLVSTERVFSVEDPGQAEAMGQMLETLLVKNLAAFDKFLLRESA